MPNNETETKSSPQPHSDTLVTHEHAGIVLGLIVLVLVLIVGGLFLWGAILSKNDIDPPIERVIPNNEPETTRATVDRQLLETTSTSVELEAIYADLESTNLNDLDSELNTIDNEMNSILE